VSREPSLAAVETGDFDWGIENPELELRIRKLVDASFKKTKVDSVFIGDTRIQPKQKYKLDQNVNKRIFDQIEIELKKKPVESAVLLLKHMYRIYNKQTDSLFTFGFLCPHDDSRFRPIFWLIRSYATEELNPLLLRIITNKKMDLGYRFGSVIVLCRPGNRSVLEPLLKIVLNPSQSDLLRTSILYRLPRIDTTVPDTITKGLEELLWEVIGHIDLAAAACLARLGNLAAPSLITDALDYGSNEIFYINTVEAIMGKEISYDRDKIKENTSTYSLEVARKTKELFLKWLKYHPEAQKTKFEKYRKHYLERIQIKQEKKATTIEEALTKKDSQIDFASCVLDICIVDKHVSIIDHNSAAFYLERLNRLSEHIKKQFPGDTADETKINIINGYLFNGRIRHSVGSMSSFWWSVMYQGGGDCVGLTSLYVSLAERLSIKIYPVILPTHVFIRLDTGNSPKNYELLYKGKVMPDEIYEKQWYDRKISLQWLENRTKTDLLSAVAANLALEHAKFYLKNYDSVYNNGQLAITLNPNNFHGYFWRAHASTKDDFGKTKEQIIADYQKALELWPDFEKCRKELNDYTQHQN
jgi:regulator of sirC expression with transglutaminase-like and TPR domain